MLYKHYSVHLGLHHTCTFIWPIPGLLNIEIHASSSMGSNILLICDPLVLNPVPLLKHRQNATLNLLFQEINLWTASFSKGQCSPKESHPQRRLSRGSSGVQYRRSSQQVPNLHQSWHCPRIACVLGAEFVPCLSRGIASSSSPGSHLPFTFFSVMCRCRAMRRGAGPHRPCVTTTSSWELYLPQPLNTTLNDPVSFPSSSPVIFKRHAKASS